MNVCPPKSSIKRFEANDKAGQVHDDDLAALGWFLMQVSSRNGWSRSIEEFYREGRLSALGLEWKPNGVELEDAPGSTARGGPPPSASACLPPEAPAAASSSSDGPAAAAAAGQSGSDQSGQGAAGGPVPQTLAAAEEAAKREQEQIRGRSWNHIHAVARMMLDEDASFETRLILYAELPETFGSGHMLKTLLGPEETRNMYAGWSQWLWLGDVKQTVRLLADLPKLYKMEFSNEMARVKLKKIDGEHPLVAFDDGRAQLVWKTPASHRKCICGSMLWHTHGAPGFSAGLIHTDLEKQKSSLQFLRACDDAIQFELASGCPVLGGMAQRQGLNSPLMRWLRKWAHLQEEGLHPVVAGVVQKMWSGIFNDKIIVDVNREVREGETRDDTKKALGRARAWQAGTNANVLQRYGRAEAHVVTQSEVPDGFDVFPHDREGRVRRGGKEVDRSHGVH